MHTSIEIAHIYGDEAFGEEQKRGLAYARHLIENSTGAVSTVIMVDNVHAEMKLDMENYRKLVELEGVPVDKIILESNMMSAALELCDRMTSPMTTQTFDRGARKQIGFEEEGRWIALINDGTPSCALLSAAFNLARFGSNVHVRPAADRIVNILPQRFMAIEEKALAIIKNSVHASFASKIDHIFHG